MISFIIPTYNRISTTHRAIESIVSQNVDVEIIVVDDASTEPYQLTRHNHSNLEIKLIRHNKNRGPAAARNTGIAAATQPLISFLDSDDYLVEDTLKQRIEFALDVGILKNESAHQIIGCSWQETNISGDVNKIRHPKPSMSSNDLFSGCWFCPGSAVIMNRTWLAETNITFDEDLKRLEDLDFFMRLGEIGAAYISQKLIGVSISASDSRYPDVVINACEAMMNKHLYDDRNLDQEQKSRLKAYLFYELSRAYISKSEYHRALDYLVKSFIQKPRLSLYPGPGWTKSTN